MRTRTATKNARTQALAYGVCRKFVVLLGAAAVLALISYMALVNQAVANVAARQRASAEVSDIKVSIGALESDYLARAGRITLSLAREKGFRDAPRPLFITRTTLGANVALRNGI